MFWEEPNSDLRNIQYFKILDIANLTADFLPIESIPNPKMAYIFPILIIVFPISEENHCTRGDKKIRGKVL